MNAGKGKNIALKKPARLERLQNPASHIHPTVGSQLHVLGELLTHVGDLVGYESRVSCMPRGRPGTRLAGPCSTQRNG